MSAKPNSEELVPEDRVNTHRQGRRRLAVGLNAVVAVGLAALLLAMVNYLSYRHYARGDWSRAKYYELSDKTHSLLNGLTNTVDVIVFFTPQNELYEDVRNLLKEYEYASDRVRVEFVDPHRNLARTEELARRFDVTELDSGVVVFDNQGRTKYVREDGIVERDYSMMQFGESPTRVAFKGEQAFSSAIQSIFQERQPKIYFLGGHEERDIESFDRFSGYSGLARAVGRDNIDIAKLVLGQTAEIPEDCDALIVAGPQKKLFQPEVDVLARYLEKNGRMIVMVDAATETGLDPLLADWGVRLVEDVVVDGTRTLTGRELFISDYGAHPIARGFQGVTSVMYFPRSVVPMGAGENGEGAAKDRPRVTVLAKSSPAGWAESDLDQNPMQYDVESDEPGPISVAVAVERGAGPGIDVEIRPTRLVVFGDSDFLANDAASGGNIDLFLSALNWLVEREELMAIAPKPIEEMRLVVDERQLRLLFWVFVLGLPGAVSVLGALVWARRRA